MEDSLGDLARLRDQADAGDEEVQAPVQRSQPPNLYCLDQRHDPRLLTDSRFFYWNLNQPGCPVCPVCNRQVQSQALTYNAKGQPMIPPNLVALADRIGERV